MKKLTNDEIDDLIERWNEDKETTLELHEYLGMTWEEYADWVQS
ncbi:hypothetical protein MYOV065v1_p0016 [Vibrio phage PS15B.2]|nr:hypothetical protein MYOV065v1_p0016 [Vibrio phage PS15B.2]QZI90846.1 hypothetical protein MYOV066v1_p0068 [Vibrio phage PS15B.3]QZI90866.1 hypothetical protein MYOV064v1_p0016 [Vibrio phage PS15B.4]